MIIADYTFRTVTGQILSASPGIFLYMHQATGKFFVRGMRNCRVQRGRKNFPTHLKEVLKGNPSEVLIWMAELPSDTKEALIRGTESVVKYLTDKGMLYKHERATRYGYHGRCPDAAPVQFTVWKMTHRKTGAVFYFEDEVGIARETILEKVAHRIRTFNNYVSKSIVNDNRSMYYFCKLNGQQKLEDWDVVDLGYEFETEREASIRITKLSRDHLVAGDIVLNRVAQNDALYYANAYLKMPHRCMEEYLSPNDEHLIPWPEKIRKVA